MRQNFSVHKQISTPGDLMGASFRGLSMSLPTVTAELYLRPTAGFAFVVVELLSRSLHCCLVILLSAPRPPRRCREPVRFLGRTEMSGESQVLALEFGSLVTAVSSSLIVRIPFPGLRERLRSIGFLLGMKAAGASVAAELLATGSS